MLYFRSVGICYLDECGPSAPQIEELCEIDRRRPLRAHAARSHKDECRATTYSAFLGRSPLSHLASCLLSLHNPKWRNQTSNDSCCHKYKEIKGVPSAHCQCSPHSVHDMIEVRAVRHNGTSSVHKNCSGVLFGFREIRTFWIGSTTRTTWFFLNLKILKPKFKFLTIYSDFIFSVYQLIS